MKKPITAMAALLFTSALTATAIAQQPGTTGAPQQGAPQTQNMPQQQNLPDASDFSDSDLDAFVATQKDMAGIQKKYSQKLQANQDTYFVEEDGDLVEGHGVFFGDEFDLWPSYSDDTVSDVAQWFTDIVGIPVVSHTDGKVYSPAA